jgi:hypothetical protein
MHEEIDQKSAESRRLADDRIHPRKLLAYSRGIRSGTRMRGEGMPRWLGEQECGARVDTEEHWWWMHGFDVGYDLRDPEEELFNLLKPHC